MANVPVSENSRVSTNSRGIRGRVEHDYEKSPGKKRVLVLGDSFTFGEEVNDTETYVYYPQQLLPGFVDVLTMVHQKILWKTGVNAKKMEELTMAILDEMAATSSRIGATPVFVYLPDEVDHLALPGQKYLLDYCQERQLLCTSVLPNFQEYVQQSGDRDLRLAGGHWKPVGHRLAAQGIADYLEQSLLATEQAASPQE